MKKLNLIIHHHALVYEDYQGFWFPSFIGSWINEITKQFGKVAFIAEMAKTKLENQDFLVVAPNLEIIPIGTRGQNSSREKNKKIHEIAEKYSNEYDQLIIRGITPRQYQVYKAFKKLPCSFLMVGSIIDSKRKLKPDFKSILLWFIYYLRRFQLRLIAKNSLVLANSPQIVKEFKSEFGIEAQFVPTNTLQNSDFDNFCFRGFKPEPVLLFCGRVVKEKGIEELILAIAQLKKAGKVFRLQIVGSITDSYKGYLNNLIIKEGIHEKVSFEGFKKFGPELFSYYLSSDFFVLPSYHEGFPHAIWEASASCTPILTTRVGGIPGLVSNREVCFIETRSVESIVQSIEFLLKNPDVAAKMVKCALEKGKQFSIQNCVNILKKNLEDESK